MNYCKGCPLKGNTTVPGSGNPKNRIIFVGEAPGENEVKFRKPFVGRSGKLLNICLKKAGMPRELFYITNVVKCRPENNRKPTEEEISHCSNYLITEINKIKPFIIIGVGKTASTFFTVNKNRNKLIRIKINNIHYLFFQIYHPAYVLRGGISEGEYIKSFLILKKYIIKICNNIKKRVEVILNVLQT